MLKLASIMRLLFISLHGNIDLGVLHIQAILSQTGKFKCFVFACQVESFFFVLELALFFKCSFVLEANSGSFQHGLICFL